MNLDDYTIEEILDNLKKRPLRFVIAYCETSNRMGANSVEVGGMDVIGGIVFCESALNYLCFVSDDWEDG